MNWNVASRLKDTKDLLFNINFHCLNSLHLYIITFTFTLKSLRKSIFKNTEKIEPLKKAQNNKGIIILRHKS